MFELKIYGFSIERNSSAIQVESAVQYLQYSYGDNRRDIDEHNAHSTVVANVLGHLWVICKTLEREVAPVR